MHRMTTRIPDNLREAIRQQAQAAGVSEAGFIRQALAKVLGVYIGPESGRVFHIPARAATPAFPATQGNTVMVPVAVMEQILTNLQSNLYINAIRDVRAAMGLGLYEAKFIVETIRDEKEKAA